MVAGTALTLFPLGVLFIYFKRARQLQWSPSAATLKSRSFADNYIPEPDMALLYKVGLAIAVLSASAAIGEFIDWTYISGPGHNALPHIALYSSFTCVGITAILESMGRLPPDSVRQTMAVVLVLETGLLHTHAMMKGDAVDVLRHEISAWISAANALALLYSIHNPKCIPAWIAGIALVLLQGMWWITLAFFISFFEADMHGVICMFTFEAVGLLLVIVFTISFVIHNPNNNDNRQLTDDNCQLTEEEEEFMPLR